MDADAARGMARERPPRFLQWRERHLQEVLFLGQTSLDKAARHG